MMDVANPSSPSSAPHLVESPRGRGAGAACPAGGARVGGGVLGSGVLGSGGLGSGVLGGTALRGLWHPAGDGTCPRLLGPRGGHDAAIRIGGESIQIMTRRRTIRSIHPSHPPAASMAVTSAPTQGRQNPAFRTNRVDTLVAQSRSRRCVSPLGSVSGYTSPGRHSLRLA